MISSTKELIQQTPDKANHPLELCFGHGTMKEKEVFITRVLLFHWKCAVGGGNSMKKIGLVAVVVLIFLVNGNLAFAQTPNYHAYELLNLLEYLYPEFLAPAPQITRLDQNGAFYRSYSDSGIVIRTKDDHLYLDYAGDSYDMGTIDDLWFPYAQAEILFNWLETQFPEFLAPVPQATQVEGAIFYRAYPETNTMIGTFDADLYFLDDQSKLYTLGGVDYLLGKFLDFEEVLAGVYTLQQKYTGRYVDAYVWSSEDYQLVTREAKNDDTQKWIIKPLGNNVYTIQQKYTGRYVDAYVWSSEDYRLVTREAKNDDTQKWIFTLVPEDMTFKGIEYNLDEAEISQPEAVVIATQRLVNNSPLEQSMSFAVNETIQEESHFERTVGFSVEVGRQLSVGVPYLTASNSISISAGMTWTSGSSVVRSHSYTATFPLRAEPYSAYRASATVMKSTLKVPYVMYFESNQTGAIRVSRGTWSGVSTWGLDYDLMKE
jgi:hypothetical protein